MKVDKLTIFITIYNLFSILKKIFSILKKISIIIIIVIRKTFQQFLTKNMTPCQRLMFA